jgi:hypothetical protein
VSSSYSEGSSSTSPFFFFGALPSQQQQQHQPSFPFSIAGSVLTLGQQTILPFYSENFFMEDDKK